MDEGNLYCNDDELLLEYYYTRRKRIIIISVILAIIFLVGAGISYLLFFNDPGLKLELTDKSVNINLSEIDETDMLDFVEIYTESGTELDVPDISDLNVPGEYTVEYVLKSEETDEKITKELEINIVDDIAPVLELSTESYELVQNSEFDFRTLITACNDNIDGNLIEKVQITGYDMRIAGMQDVVFTIEDKAGNVTEKSIILYVTAVQTPEQNTPATTQNESEISQEHPTNQNSTSTQTSGQSSSSNSQINSSNTLDGRRFMFSDGYDMGNVMGACKSALIGAGETGTCQPIYENGVIVGVEIQQ